MTQETAKLIAELINARDVAVLIMNDKLTKEDFNSYDFWKTDHVAASHKLSALLGGIRIVTYDHQS